MMSGQKLSRLSTYSAFVVTCFTLNAEPLLDILRWRSSASSRLSSKRRTLNCRASVIQLPHSILRGLVYHHPIETGSGNRFHKFFESERLDNVAVYPQLVTLFQIAVFPR